MEYSYQKLHSNKDEQILTEYNIDESHKYNTGRKKPDTKQHKPFRVNKIEKHVKPNLIYM